MYNGWDVKYSGKTVRRCRYFCTASAYTLRTNKNNSYNRERKNENTWEVISLKPSTKFLSSNNFGAMKGAAMNYGCVFELRYLIMYSKVSKNRTATEKIPPTELWAFLPCQFGLAFLYFPFLFSSCFLFCKCHFNEDGCLHIKVKLMKEDGFGKKKEKLQW